MNKELKIRVIKRLTNKSTRKTVGYLCRPLSNRHYAYCVLGVVARELGVKPTDMLQNGSLESISGYGDLYEQSGLNKQVEAKLVNLNDEEHLSFNQLAKTIQGL